MVLDTPMILQARLALSRSLASIKSIILTMYTYVVLSCIAGNSPTVSVMNGTLYGVHLPDFNQDAFLGVPYAQPPTGSLRFAPPVPLTTSFGHIPARSYGPACRVDSRYLEQSEDCLSLNVIRPSGNYSDLPVAVWIHGGGFYDGSSSRPAYNLSYIVQTAENMGKPFIGVSINYRLGWLGFGASRELVRKGWTNVAIRDQIQAVNWVHENIAAFGGDPEHIVLWGESAGGISVGKLLLSQKVPFVKGGIMQSGTGIMKSVFGVGHQAYQNDYDTMVEYFNCSSALDTVECLQHVDSHDLQFVANASNGILQTQLYPVIDGDIIPKSAYESYKAGEFLKVPILIGSNTDEGNGFTSPAVKDLETATSFMHSVFPFLTNTSIERIYDEYTDPAYPLSPLDPTYGAVFIPSNDTLPFSAIPYDSYTDTWRRISQFFTDSYFGAASRFVSQFHTDHGLPVFKYRHNIPNENWRNVTGVIGTTHYVEVSYVFHNGQQEQNYRDSSDGKKWWDDQRSEEASKKMAKMWASFISDLDPNFDGTDHKWRSYGDGKRNMVFDINGFYEETDDWRENGVELIRELRHQLML